MSESIPERIDTPPLDAIELGAPPLTPEAVERERIDQECDVDLDALRDALRLELSLVDYSSRGRDDPATSRTIDKHLAQASAARQAELEYIRHRALGDGSGHLVPAVHGPSYLASLERYLLPSPKPEDGEGDTLTDEDKQLERNVEQLIKDMLEPKIPYADYPEASHDEPVHSPEVHDSVAETLAQLRPATPEVIVAAEAYVARLEAERTRQYRVDKDTPGLEGADLVLANAEITAARRAADLAIGNETEPPYAKAEVDKAQAAVNAPGGKTPTNTKALIVAKNNLEEVRHAIASRSDRIAELNNVPGAPRRLVDRIKAFEVHVTDTTSRVAAAEAEYQVAKAAHDKLVMRSGSDAGNIHRINAQITLRHAATELERERGFEKSDKSELNIARLTFDGLLGAATTERIARLEATSVETETMMHQALRAELELPVDLSPDNLEAERAQHGIFVAFQKMRSHIEAIDNKLVHMDPTSPNYAGLRAARLEAFGIYMRASYAAEQSRIERACTSVAESFDSTTVQFEGRYPARYLPGDSKAICIERSDGLYILYPDASFAPLGSDGTIGDRRQTQAPSPNNVAGDFREILETAEVMLSPNSAANVNVHVYDSDKLEGFYDDMRAVHLLNQDKPTVAKQAFEANRALSNRYRADQDFLRDLLIERTKELTPKQRAEYATTIESYEPALAKLTYEADVISIGNSLPSPDDGARLHVDGAIKFKAEQEYTNSHGLKINSGRLTWLRYPDGSMIGHGTNDASELVEIRLDRWGKLVTKV